MITYGFFNSVSGDRKYNAEQMTRYFDGLIGNGVFESVGNALQVVAGGGMTVNVKTGRAMIDCHWMQNDSLYSVEITPANGLQARYTAVIVRLDNSARLIEITTKDGTPGAPPVAPSIADNELCIALVYVGPGVTSITQANITDTRPDSNICGWVTGLIEQLDTSTLFAQWNDAYYTYYQNMTAGFDEWMRTLTSQLNINTYVRKYEKVVTLAGSSTEIELDMSGYVYEESDIIAVYINGLRGISGIDYTVDTDTGAITPTPTKTGTKIHIVVLKSIIGYYVVGTSAGDAIADSVGSAIML